MVFNLNYHIFLVKSEEVFLERILDFIFCSGILGKYYLDVVPDCVHTKKKIIWRKRLE